MARTPARSARVAANLAGPARKRPLPAPAVAAY